MSETTMEQHPTPLEAREALVLLIRARASRARIEAAADTYIAAIKRRAQATKRRFPTPTRAAIIRLLSDARPNTRKET